VVVETTGLIKGKDKESILPLRTSTERLVDLLEESLTIRDQTTVVHGGGANTTARWVKVGESWQDSTESIRVELGHGNSLVLIARCLGPGECLRIGTRATGSIPVVEPGDVLLAQCLEDRHLGE
jgi:hypothetical protein